jgi:hypothetical protein
MNPVAPVAGRFISAVRRRILLVQIAESIAISIAVASAIGLAVLPILWWRGQSAVPLAIAMLATGCFFGLIWGISRRPSLLEAAIEADTQLNLHDLLGTVMQIDKNPSTLAWQTTIAAFADNRCRTLHPSAIIVSRMGLRGWAGVGILGALLLTFALLTARPATVTAESSVLGYAPVESSPPMDTIPRADDSSTSLSRPPGPGGPDSNSSRDFPENHIDNSMAESIPANNSSAPSSTGAGSSPGSGTATAKTPAPPPESPTVPNAGQPPQHSAAIADGAGMSNSPINVAGENNSKMASPGPAKRVAPWTSATWTTDSAAATTAISAGQVPEEDTDIVRDYFRRD